MVNLALALRFPSLLKTTKAKSQKVSNNEAVKSALYASAALLWDVSGDRNERGPPPTFSTRAVRSGLLSAWHRYENSLKVRITSDVRRLAHTGDWYPFLEHRAEIQKA